MKPSDNKYFDRSYYIQRNKEIAIERYGNQLDENNRIKGTGYYFDSEWRLCGTKEGV